ncbi:unnamed protein product [Callosobruchus maculatus]|uniref:Uncharacterized protein n=1 Tax=Callosobruchus maculatus TaxID=64391 RepID=A0A653BSZ6_CALMS|nr:unnamed protein product [Callosobruchus maculatus]
MKSLSARPSTTAQTGLLYPKTNKGYCSKLSRGTVDPALKKSSICTLSLDCLIKSYRCGFRTEGPNHQKRI